jgi:hypothetical protein
MKKLQIKKSISRFIKCHILCAHSAFIDKNAMAALQDSFSDLSKFLFHIYIVMLIASVFGFCKNCFLLL